jgi:hypothetical protein
LLSAEGRSINRSFGAASSSCAPAGPTETGVSRRIKAIALNRGPVRQVDPHFRIWPISFGSDLAIRKNVSKIWQVAMLADHNSGNASRSIIISL